MKQITKLTNILTLNDSCFGPELSLHEKKTHPEVKGVL